MSDHQHQYLENVSVEYKNDELIGNLLLPIVPVKFKSDDVAVFRKRGNTVYDTKRGADGKSNRIRWEYEKGTYACENYALHDFVTKKRIRNADKPIEPLVRATQTVTNAVLLAREKRIADLVQNAATYPAGNVINLNSGTYKPWSDAAGTPYDNILEAKERCAVEPNALFMGRSAWYHFRKNAAVKGLVSGGATTENPAIIKLSGLNDLLELEYIVVGKAFYDATPKNAAETRANLWGGHAILAYVSSRPSLDMFSFGMMPMWTENGGTGGYKVNQWDDPSIDGGATFIEVEEDVDEFIICPTAACLLQNCVV